MKYWVTFGDVNYLPIVEVLVKSLLKSFEYTVIVYGIDCYVNTKLVYYVQNVTINAQYQTF